MEIPESVLKAFGLLESETKFGKEQEQLCPIRCNPERTELRISKTSRRNKGNFVNVYYRSGRLKKGPTLIELQDKFWRDLNDIIERSSKPSKKQSRKIEWTECSASPYENR